VHDGWRPVSDNAGIALRSWDVLTAHGPLVGQATRLAGGVYNPGPLQYWLLTFPVHIDPVHGVLWGAALWCMLACSLTIEAAWSAAGTPGGLLATAIVLGALAWSPGITMVPSWNPWFGMMYFLAAIAAGLATLCGHRGWWPVLVVTGSIAAQAHLMFTITAAVLILLGLAVGLVDTHRARAGYRWAVIGLIATLACWTAPLIQEFTIRTGNITALSAAQGQPGSQGGLPFGLQALAASAQPPPFWWTPVESHLKLALIDKRSAAVGAVALALAVAVLVVAAYPLRSRRAVALAAVSLTVAITAMILYSHIPQVGITMDTVAVDHLRYLMAPMFAVGILFWLAAGTVLVMAGRRAMSRVQSRPTASGDETAISAPQMMAASWAARMIGFWVVAIMGLASFAGVEIVNSPMFQSTAMRAVGVASQQIERDISSRQIMLSVIAPDNRSRRQVAFGLAYALHAVGYLPEIKVGFWALQLGSIYIFRGKPMPHVTVLMRGSDLSGLSVDVTKPLSSQTVGRRAR
jgi:hypothetical protein